MMSSEPSRCATTSLTRRTQPCRSACFSPDLSWVCPWPGTAVIELQCGRVGVMHWAASICVATVICVGPEAIHRSTGRSASVNGLLQLGYVCNCLQHMAIETSILRGVAMLAAVLENNRNPGAAEDTVIAMHSVVASFLGRHVHPLWVARVRMHVQAGQRRPNQTPVRRRCGAWLQW